MTFKNQRLIIAEFLGLQWDEVIDGHLYEDVSERGFPDRKLRRLSDPLTDLNVMHAVEEKFTDEQWKAYEALLADRVVRAGIDSKARSVAHATPMLKAEVAARLLEKRVR